MQTLPNHPIEIRRYASELKAEWNNFIANSKNGTFLFDRNYMDYHADRFHDMSLMFYLKNRLYALLPANVSGSTLFSHQGLTYGGLIMNSDATISDIMDLFHKMNEHLRINGIKHVLYKPTPYIYHSIPAEEDLYAITEVCHAKLTTREISSTIMMDNKPKFKELRRRCVKKAKSNGLSVTESNDIGQFWDILDKNLMKRHGVHPVHTKEELQLLKSRFPERIKLYAAMKGEAMLGGVILYVTRQTVHTQYISANEEGRKVGALDLVFDYLINGIPTGHKYFDFGKSTEENGHLLNESLIHQKEGFGGRGVCYDYYEWDL